MESIFLGLPIGAYVLNAPSDPDSPFANWLLDGQQRWDTIRGFVAGEFAVRGRFYASFSQAERRHFLVEPFPAYVTQFDNEERLRDVFERLAFGGTPNVRL